MGSNQAVDAQLLEACRRGDPRGFEELVRRTERQVFTLALRITGDRAEAEDVAQDAYLRVFRSLGGFREDARFETWLYRVVVNAAMTHLKKRGRFGSLLRDPEEVPEQVAAERAEGSAIDRDEVRRALEALPQGMRTAVVLKDMYGLSCREIGEELGLSEGAVKVRLHRARKRMKELIHGTTRNEV